MTGYLATLLLSIFFLIICFGTAIYSRYMILDARKRKERLKWLFASIVISALGIAFAALKLQGGGFVSMPFTTWLTALLLNAALALWVASVIYRIRTSRIVES